MIETKQHIDICISNIQKCLLIGAVSDAANWLKEMDTRAVDNDVTQYRKYGVETIVESIRKKMQNF